MVIDSQGLTMNLRATAGSMITTERVVKALEFIKNSGFDLNDFINKYEKSKPAVLVDIPERELVGYEENENEDFNDEVGRFVDISNTDFSERQFFYNKFFKVVSSSWDNIIIKVDEGVYAKIRKDAIYEWDDLK